MNLAEAKQRLTIYELWRHYGFEGEPSKSCRCPFHDDKSASFSLFTGKDRLDAFNCFAGCGGGDAVDFFQLASGVPHREACRAFIAHAGGSPVAPMPRHTPTKADSEAVHVPSSTTYRLAWLPSEIFPVRRQFQM